MKNGNKKNSAAFSTKKLAVCSMLCALGVIMLSLGSLVDVLDITMAVVASLFCIFAVIEYGGSAPWMIYISTSLLALILAPMPKTAAFLYIVFFGFYPIIKEKIEKRRKLVRWILKEIVFNICLAIIILAGIFIFKFDDTSLTSPLTITILVVLSEFVFILYDVALTRIITFYLIKLRKRFKLK